MEMPGPTTENCTVCYTGACADGASCEDAGGQAFCQCPPGTSGDPQAGGAGCVQDAVCDENSCTGENMICQAGGANIYCMCNISGCLLDDGNMEIIGPSSANCSQGMGFIYYHSSLLAVDPSLLELLCILITAILLPYPQTAIGLSP